MDYILPSAIRSMSLQPHRQWHDVRTLPINALKVLEGVWGNFFQEVSPSHPPHPLASPRSLKLTVDEIAGVVANAVRAENEDERDRERQNEGKENGARAERVAQRETLCDLTDCKEDQNSAKQNDPLARRQTEREETARKQLRPLPACEHTPPETEGSRHVAVNVQTAEQPHQQEGADRLKTSTHPKQRGAARRGGSDPKEVATPAKSESPHS